MLLMWCQGVSVSELGRRCWAWSHLLAFLYQTIAFRRRGNARLKPSPPFLSVAVYFDWQLARILIEAMQVVPDSFQVEHCLFHTIISRKNVMLTATNLSLYGSAYVCVFKNARVLTWVFDRPGEQHGGRTTCESDQDGTKREGMIK